MNVEACLDDFGWLFPLLAQVGDGDASHFDLSARVHAATDALPVAPDATVSLGCCAWRNTVMTNVASDASIAARVVASGATFSRVDASDAPDFDERTRENDERTRERGHQNPGIDERTQPLANEPDNRQALGMKKVSGAFDPRSG